MTTVEHVMSREVVSISPDANVHELLHLLAQEQISGVPVITDNGRLVGVVSASDIVVSGAVHTDGASASWYNYQVEDIMTPAVLSVRPEMTLAEVADFMLRAHVHRVLVTRGEQVLGIVTTFDVMRMVAEDACAFDAPACVLT